MPIVLGGTGISEDRPLSLVLIFASISTKEDHSFFRVCFEGLNDIVINEDVVGRFAVGDKTTNYLAGVNELSLQALFSTDKQEIFSGISVQASETNRQETALPVNDPDTFS